MCQLEQLAENCQRSAPRYRGKIYTETPPVRVRALLTTNNNKLEVNPVGFNATIAQKCHWAYNSVSLIAIWCSFHDIAAVSKSELQFIIEHVQVSIRLETARPIESVSRIRVA